MGKRTGPVKEPSTVRSRRNRAGASGTEAAPEVPNAAGPSSAESPGVLAPDESSEIRHGIAETRAELDGTLDQLQERLSPGHVKEQVRESLKETIDETKTALRAATVGKVETMIRDTGNTLSEARQSIWDTVRENPVPAALSAIGLTWLFLNRGGRNRSEGHLSARRYAGGFEPDEYGRGYGERDRGLTARAGSAVRQVREQASDVAESVKEHASDAVESAQKKAGELASTASETVERVADRAQVQVRRVEQAVGHWMDDNPLAVGAVALAAGTAIGLALPRTEKEDRLLGSARDTVVERAEELAGRAMDTVRERLTEVEQGQQTH